MLAIPGRKLKPKSAVTDFYQYVLTAVPFGGIS
ncbi:hypothetical protein FHT77_005699 [Rhizobium sp. BK181]|nr:hypothetical protein [Rhizobium sp. BK181]